MFYCYDCMTVNNLPESLAHSEGKCEICGRHAICNDVPSKHLPMKPLVPSTGGEGKEAFKKTDDMKKEAREEVAKRLKGLMGP